MIIKSPVSNVIDLASWAQRGGVASVGVAQVFPLIPKSRITEIDIIWMTIGALRLKEKHMLNFLVEIRKPFNFGNLNLNYCLELKNAILYIYICKQTCLELILAS